MPGALPLDLKVRRVRDGLEVVIENAGSAPQLEQTREALANRQLIGQKHPK